MYISIVGSSSIIYHHIQAAKKNSFKILYIYTSNKDSKNVKKLVKKFKIKKIYYNWKSFVKDSAEKKSSILIAGQISQNKKILEECLKYDLKVIIEKPVFTNSNIFQKFLKFKKNIFIGYNRIYYSGIEKLETILKKNKIHNVIIKCPETNKKNITLNSCHIFSIIYYLFGKLSLIKKIKLKENIFCIFKNRKNCYFYIFFNFNCPENFSIEFNFKKKKLILCPIEKLISYNKLNVKISKKMTSYEPNIEFTVSNKTKKIKPGFEKQYLNFKKFISEKKCKMINVEDAQNIVKSCNSI
jgi:hypothetical protein